MWDPRWRLFWSATFTRGGKEVMTRREGPTQGGRGAKRQERGDRQSERARHSL